MSETYTFQEAAPVKRAARKGAGRRAEPNPFEAAVREIAGRVDGDGTPLARSTAFTLDAENGETLKQRRDRIRRFLTRAGKLVSDERGGVDVSIELRIKPYAANSYEATFWDRHAGN